MTKAVIDVGSNSVLLLVERYNDGRWLPLFESTHVTGLGRETNRTGRLSEEGMAETLGALATCFEQARAHGATDIVAAATMAARIATNSDEFLARAQAQNTPVVVISGDEEAEYGFRCVAEDPLFAHEPRLTIIDVGGHSTELMTADRTPRGWQTLFRRSFPIGALGLRAGVLSDPSPAIPARLHAVAQIDDTLGLTYLPHSCGRVVTLGATGVNLITIRERMAEWDSARVHGQELDYEEISKAVGWMFDMDDAQRAAIVGMERGRERTLHIGALILERFLHAVKSLTCTVSTRGWRHGLLENSAALDSRS